MLAFQSFLASTQTLDNIVLTWENIPTDESLAGYVVDVYRSGTPNLSNDGDNFTLLANNIPYGDFTHTDSSVKNVVNMQWHDWYYRLKVYPISDPNTFIWSDEAHVQIKGDSKAKIVLSIRKKALEKYGTDISILKKRHSGSACSICYDETLGRVILDNCPECFGTRVTKGYYDRILIKATMSMRPKENQITPYGTWQNGDALIGILDYPILNPDDLLIDSLNRRWKVRQVSPTEVMNTLVGQQAHITLQEQANPVHDINIIDYS